MNETLSNQLKVDSELQDGQARFDAINPQQSVIVQAPAGSGKTALLTQRFLALLAQVESPEHIIAMTFTKKAAAEMQDRIFQALQLSRQPKPSDNVFEENTWYLAKAAMDNDRSRGWQLLDNPQRLRVRTLDSMNTALVQQMPLLSRFGASASVTENPDKLYREAAREALNDVSVAKASTTLLAKVNGNLTRAENLLIAMLKKRDQWMPLLNQLNLHAEGHSSDDKQAFDHALAKLVMMEFSAWHQRLANGFLLLEKARRVLLSVPAENRPEASGWSCLETLKIEQNLPGWGELSAWRVLANALLTAKGEFRSRLTKKEGFSNNTQEEKDLKERFSEVLSELAAKDVNGQMSEGLTGLRELPEPLYTEDQWQGVRHLMTLLRTTAGYLKVAFAKAGQTDFIEIAQAASNALGEEESPTDLAQRLDYQIKHLLIDEFQDTSVSQFAFLKKLVAGWQMDDEHSLFIVGDPMQSIYRFREAEVGNFLEAWQGSLGQVSLEKRQLTVNFRSDKALVDWVNQVFPTVLPAQSEIERGAVHYSPSSARKTSDEVGLGVETHWALNRSAEQEVSEVVALIQSRLSVLESGQSIGVLGRSRSVLMPIALALKSEGVAFRAVDLETLNERQEIQDALALTRALLHVSDRPAWLALLRSPAIGLGLADLYQIFGDSSRFRHPVLPSLLDEQRLQNLTEEGRQRLKFSVPILQRSLGQVGYLPWSQLIRECWLALGMSQAIESETALQNLEAYWQMLSGLEREQELLTFDRLEQAMEALYAMPDASELAGRVELMTMHKSKGLEFDTVILPGLDRAARSDDKPLLTWLNFKSEHQDYLVMAPLDQKGKAKGQTGSKLVSFIQKFEAEKQGYELGRLFYVAATRAKQQLHLFANLSVTEAKLEQLEAGKTELKPAEKSLLYPLWVSQQGAFIELLNSVSIPEDSQEEAVEVPRVSRVPLKGLALAQTWWQGQLKSERQNAIQPIEQSQEFADVMDVMDVSAYAGMSEADALMITAIGNLVHAMLEQWVQTGRCQQALGLSEQELALCRYWLMQQGLNGEILQTALERVERSLSNALANPKLHWALDSSHQESATELPLSSVGLAIDKAVTEISSATQHHIVDRTFVDEDGVRWIVDYKTSYWHDKMPMSKQAFIKEKVDEYRPQLVRYGRLFAELENRAQTFVLYFTYLDEWIEVPIQIER